MATLCIEGGVLTDIAIVGHRVEGAIALCLEVAPLTLEFAKEVFLVALEEFAGAIRATGHCHIGQQMGLLIDRDHQFRILDAVEVALEIIGVGIIVGRDLLLEACHL